MIAQYPVLPQCPMPNARSRVTHSEYKTPNTARQHHLGQTDQSQLAWRQSFGERSRARTVRIGTDKETSLLKRYSERKLEPTLNYITTGLEEERQGNKTTINSNVFPKAKGAPDNGASKAHEWQYPLLVTKTQKREKFAE